MRQYLLFLFLLPENEPEETSVILFFVPCQQRFGTHMTFGYYNMNIEYLYLDYSFNLCFL